VRLAGRPPFGRWAQGARAEPDQPPLPAPVTKMGETAGGPDTLAAVVARAFATAAAPHRGPVFLDVHMDHLFGPAGPARPGEIPDPPERPADPERLARAAALLKAARRPVRVLGSDVWMDGAETAGRPFAEGLRL